MIFRAVSTFRSATALRIATLRSTSVQGCCAPAARARMPYTPKSIGVRSGELANQGPMVLKLRDLK